MNTIDEKIKKMQDKIKELNENIEYLQNCKTGLFLLSFEEYEKYRNKITSQRSWWLRSPGNFGDINNFMVTAMTVESDGGVFYCGGRVSNVFVSVRPALYIPNLESLNLPSHTVNGIEMVRYKNIDWLVLDKESGLCLSAYNLFCDKFDDKSNNYDNSYIKQKLEEISIELGIIDIEKINTIDEDIDFINLE